MTMTVMMMEAMTKTMVNSMYFPIRGTALEVDGMSSTMTSRNTVSDSRTEMLSVIFSPERQTSHRLEERQWRDSHPTDSRRDNLVEQTKFPSADWLLENLVKESEAFRLVLAWLEERQTQI